MNDMTTHQFLLGFRRFIARHGKPNKIISDNAAQFKLASDTISRLWGKILTEKDTCHMLPIKTFNGHLQ